MTSYSEIQKLEQRWRDNPDGRAFAPLADAYRKAGYVGKAVELVRAGLLKHPDYVSAHIVLGRCLRDQSDATGAQGAFERVLELDSENIIALKTLSDLAEQAGQLAQAEQWLSRVLEVDPMNSEAREALARVRGGLEAAPVVVEEVGGLGGWTPVPAASAQAPPLPEPAKPVASVAASGTSRPSPGLEARGAPEVREGAAAGVEGSEPGVEVVRSGAEAWGSIPRTDEPTPVEGVLIERAGEDAGEPVAPERGPPPSEVPADEFESFEGRVAFSGVEAPPPEELGIELEEQVAPEITPEEIPEVPGLAATQYESGQFSVPPEARDPDLAPLEWRTGPEESKPVEAQWLEWETEPPSEPEAPVSGAEAGEDFAERVRRESALADLPVFMPEEEPAAATSSFEEPPADAEGDAVEATHGVEEDYAAADHDSLGEAEPVVTETMAELLVAQGHRHAALEVYRTLLRERPGDVALERRIAMLEGKPLPAEGPTVGQIFQRLVAARLTATQLSPPLPPVVLPRASVPEAVPPLEEHADEVRPPALGPVGPLSLDQVFGDVDAEAGGVPGPARASEAPAPRSDPGPPVGFSFDAFFGGESTPPPPSGAKPEDPEGDLDEFQAWLRGLKS